MKRTLTKIEGGRISRGPTYGTGPSYRYQVQGLPDGEEADIAEFNNFWKILKVKDGVQGEWAGVYATADEALAALQKEYD